MIPEELANCSRTPRENTIIWNLSIPKLLCSKNYLIANSRHSNIYSQMRFIVGVFINAKLLSNPFDIWAIRT